MNNTVRPASPQAPKTKEGSVYCADLFETIRQMNAVAESMENQLKRLGTRLDEHVPPRPTAQPEPQMLLDNPELPITSLRCTTERFNKILTELEREINRL